MIISFVHRASFYAKSRQQRQWHYSSRHALRVFIALPVLKQATSAAQRWSAARDGFAVLRKA
jgi:hypothetical protein